MSDELSAMQDIMGKASVQAAEVELQKQQKLKAEVEPLAAEYLEINAQIKELESRKSKVRRKLEAYGDWETDNFKCTKGQGGKTTYKLAKLEDFERVGYTKDFLISKGLVKVSVSSGAFRVTDRRKK